MNPEEKVQVFVPLLEEGTDCWRPALAVPLGGDSFRLVPEQPMPDDERWAFEPGECVVCEERTFADGTTSLAVVRRLAVPSES